MFVAITSGLPGVSIVITSVNVAPDAFTVVTVTVCVPIALDRMRSSKFASCVTVTFPLTTMLAAGSVNPLFGDGVPLIVAFTL